jgi:hypothetical protein
VLLIPHNSIVRIPLVARRIIAMVNTDFSDQRYHRPMSDKPPTGPPPAHDASGFAAARGSRGFPPAPPSPQPWPSAPPKPSRWLTFLALAIALVGFGTGVAAWFRAAPHNSPNIGPPTSAYTERQIADAKQNVCDAYALVRTAVSVTTNKRSSGGDAFATQTAIAANGRLALYGGGGYLLEQLSAEPATPSDLANAVKSLAGTFRKLAMVDLGEQPESAQTPLRNAVPGTTAKIDEICK